MKSVSLDCSGRDRAVSLNSERTLGMCTERGKTQVHETIQQPLRLPSRYQRKSPCWDRRATSVCCDRYVPSFLSCYVQTSYLILSRMWRCLWRQCDLLISSLEAPNVVKYSYTRCFLVGVNGSTGPKPVVYPSKLISQNWQGSDVNYIILAMYELGPIPVYEAPGA